MAEDKELRYDPAAIEPKWQQRWAADPKLYAAEPATCGKPKYYVLEMLPYPSGQLHMGHVRNYSIGDALARHMWMRGYNVLHPMGWDAFGLPAENAALKNNTPPRQWTLSNIAGNEAAVGAPGHGLRLGHGSDHLPARLLPLEPVVLSAHVRARAGLPQEEQGELVPGVRHGAGQRAGGGRLLLAARDTKVEQRDLVQWFFRITAYAQELLDGLDKLDGWPEKVRTMQRNWIGRSEGTEVDFFLEEGREQGIREQGIGNREKRRAFACLPRGWIRSLARPACSLAPQHALVAEFTGCRSGAEGAGGRADRAAEEGSRGWRPGRDREARRSDRALCREPYNGERVPIWVANYILADYGTGAIMSVPAHDERDFEFAHQVRPADCAGDSAEEERRGRAVLPFVSEDGVLVNSGEFDGLSCARRRRSCRRLPRARGLARPRSPSA
jgi:leucyl-tRNA synthetase